ncbi:hypothetical protein V1477_017408 [Vespula maculifrons]|uniref:Uncharacterized protein n=1 Tax=Vespula maculifrons TaxID=7453 RepID=A0ABD2B604_VESMC
MAGDASPNLSKHSPHCNSLGVHVVVAPFNTNESVVSEHLIWKCAPYSSEEPPPAMHAFGKEFSPPPKFHALTKTMDAHAFQFNMAVSTANNQK